MFLHLSVSHSVHGGGCLGPHPGGRLGGVWPGGCPGPHLGVGVCVYGGVQAQGRGVQAQAWGGIPACTEADTPQQTATAVGGTYNTGMYSCWATILDNHLSSFYKIISSFS